MVVLDSFLAMPLQQFKEVLNGMHAGATGFVSGGGSLIIGFGASAGASLMRSHVECNGVGVQQSLDALLYGACPLWVEK